MTAPTLIIGAPTYPMLLYPPSKSPPACRIPLPFSCLSFHLALLSTRCLLLLPALHLSCILLPAASRRHPTQPPWSSSNWCRSTLSPYTVREADAFLSANYKFADNPRCVHYLHGTAFHCGHASCRQCESHRCLLLRCQRLDRIRSKHVSLRHY